MRDKALFMTMKPPLSERGAVPRDVCSRAPKGSFPSFAPHQRATFPPYSSATCLSYERGWSRPLFRLFRDCELWRAP